MSDLRIFSYLPNPRIWKATITARLLDVDVDVRGAPPRELGQWLWDFDARPLTEADRADPSLQRQGRTGFRGELFESDAFLAAHPYGTVPRGIEWRRHGRDLLFEEDLANGCSHNLQGPPDMRRA